MCQRTRQPGQTAGPPTCPTNHSLTPTHRHPQVKLGDNSKCFEKLRWRNDDALINEVLFNVRLLPLLLLRERRWVGVGGKLANTPLLAPHADLVWRRERRVQPGPRVLRLLPQLSPAGVAALSQRWWLPESGARRRAPLLHVLLI